jgi:hypothetical protein
MPNVFINYDTKWGQYLRLVRGDLLTGSDRIALAVRKARNLSMERTMFYADESVWSRQFGFGVVTRSGSDPTVQFLHGLDLVVDGEKLRIIPDEAYDAEVRNRLEIEAWLTRRLSGRPEPQPMPLPRATQDLAERMMRFARLGDLPRRKESPPRIFVDEITRFP